MTALVRASASWLAWPGLLGLCLGATAIGFASDLFVPVFNATYLALALALLGLERWIPHERAWTRSDGQWLPDILHTLLSDGTIQVAIVFSGAIGLSALVAPTGGAGLNIWPRHWPLAGQIVLGLVLSEFALYWAHRIAHEWRPLWHFHAVHHSVERLWCVNSGRFHFVDALKSALPGIAILLAVGAPMEVLVWLSAITAYIGILTHCNVAMRFGPLSMLFNTPELHRWHHSTDLREGNKNYGENIMLWDWVFGTYFNARRRPPVSIGIRETMPRRFGAQVAWPFRQLLGLGGAGSGYAPVGPLDGCPDAQVPQNVR